MTSTTKSSLGSRVDRSAVHLRSSSTQDNWGGDETVTLNVLDLDLKLRLEWGEGVSDRWDLWIFEEDADIQSGDFILIEQAVNLSLTVMRVTSFTDLRGNFHHFEVLTEEHEKTVAELKTAAGI